MRGARGEERVMDARPTARGWERLAWAAGIVFFAFLVAEIAVSVGIPIDQNDSAAKIATTLDEHRRRLVVIACLSIVYAVAFVIYLWRLYRLVREGGGRTRALGPLVLIGGVLFVSLHAVSDIGITGMLGAKVASYAAQNEQGIAYTLYLTTFALDSVGDVFGSLFAAAVGLHVLRSRVLPRWLGWTAIVLGALFFLQGFGLGGVIATFGLVLDLIGFVLLLIFALVSSVILLRRQDTVAAV
jgi:hypothetical protein